MGETIKVPPELYCPSCNRNSENIVSCGCLRWQCRLCGRKFSKTYRPKIILNDPTRPACPDCYTPNPYSSSKAWICRNCGRQYRKNYPKEVVGLKEYSTKIKTR